MVLREFLYLDSQIVIDYLSALDGYDTEGAIEETKIGKTGFGGSVGGGLAKAEANRDSTIETRRKLAITDPARFQKLYDMLHGSGEIQQLDAFDDAIWQQLRRGEVVEIESLIRLPQGIHFAKSIEDFAPLLDLLADSGEDPFNDPTQRAKIDIMNKLMKSDDNQSVPILFQPISTPDYSFAANLSKKHLRREISELESEAIIFGKIQKIIPKDQKHEICNLMPAFTSLSKNLNRAGKRKLQNNMEKMGVVENINGPAIIIRPIAVYR